jgi:hypothetical protein
MAVDHRPAADIMMSFPLEAARSRAGLDERRPATIAWLERIHASTIGWKRFIATLPMTGMRLSTSSTNSGGINDPSAYARASRAAGGAPARQVAGDRR